MRADDVPNDNFAMTSNADVVFYLGANFEFVNFTDRGGVPVGNGSSDAAHH